MTIDARVSRRAEDCLAEAPAVPGPVASADRPVLGGALEPITGEVLKRRSLEVSSTSFTTIISIILGVALALLAQNTFPRLSPLVSLQSACLLLLFVCTFHYFLSMSVVLRWAPSFMDCSSPFIITSLEIPPAYFLGQVSAWSGWIAVLFLFVAAGVSSTVKYSPICHFGGDRRAQKMLHATLLEITAALLTGAFLLGAIAVLARALPAA
ncbi:hypothetical protein ACQP2F_19770 [Actinoplanes sp. CA-030573]|uniref:hypothetical protein n=1 Tax=Actinoplanes sp. CA-030573 TaxID=3239898 RepID=UPI003D90406E